MAASNLFGILPQNAARSQQCSRGRLQKVGLAAQPMQLYRVE